MESLNFPLHKQEMNYLAYLNLINEKPKNIFSIKISWIRMRDFHILTNGMITYTSDARFSILHTPNSGEWSLQVQKLHTSDAE